MCRSALALACGALLAFAGPAAAQVNSAYLVRVADGKPVVETIPPESFPPPAKTRGLLIWSDAAGDHWLPLTDDRSVEQLAAAKQADKPGEGGFSRGGRGGGGTEMALAGLTRTNLIPPANPSGTVRGGEPLSPVRDSSTLNRAPVFRRLPMSKGPEYPAVELGLRLVSGDTPFKATAVPVPAGMARFTLPELPPGVYELAVPTDLGVERVQFQVQSPETRARILCGVDRLEKEFGPDDPLVTLFAVETLLNAGRPKNNAPEYLGDAIDRLEKVPPEKLKLSPYLQATLKRLRKQARSLAVDKLVRQADVPPDPGATGIEAIDRARAALQAGDYAKADAALDTVKEGADPRAGRLATLYRAVRLGEAGAGADADAEALFTRAVAETPEAERGDRFRAHANFALFYQRRAQDRLNNHAFQMAAGVARTVSAVAADWAAARDQYEAAAKFATPELNAGLEMDRARLYALLADLVRTLAPASKDLIAAASAAADRAAEAAGKAAADEVSRGIAHEIRGQLAFRNGDADTCREETAAAAAEFVAAGFLPGVENAQRLLGQLAVQTGDDRAAFRHLTASHLIAELLRERFPADQVGRTRAGFFARRAFVLDTLVELQLKAKNFEAALELAEAAKGRAFTDVLSAEGIREGGNRPRPPVPSLAAVLQNWPKDRPTAAVEYFLARDRVWAFVVTTAGGVKAVELQTPGQKPVDPRDLIALARGVVGDMEGQARKMANRILNDEGYDNSWQDELHLLARILLPPAVLEEMRKAEVVLLAPQHVLHYLPFAALVLEKDTAATPKQLARPKRFLIDEKFVTVNVPSITGWAAIPRPRTPPPRNARAVGLVQAPGEPRLDGVEKDLANLKEAFGPALREVLREEGATPAKAAELFNRPGLLLLATHGFNDPDAPLESFLVLYPDGDRSPNGRLRAADIYKLPVGADVVVMSACYTGLGDRSPLPGDDLFGLQRAFLQAGARVVVAGLWDVYDLTAPDLMRGCLTRLAAGVPAARALKEAQKAFLDGQRAKPGDQPYIHPYFWAVYSALGDDRAGVGTR
jgi:CHAT domain-containing protein